MTAADVAVGAGEVHALSLDGGPLHRLEKRLHLEPLARSIVVAVALTWGVSVALALIETVRGIDEGGTQLLARAGGHARLLVGIPLLLFAERILALRAAGATRRLLAENIISPESTAQWSRVARRIEGLRESGLPEVVLAGAVVALTAAGLLGLLPDGFLRWAAPTLHPSVRSEAAGSAALWWFIGVAQPLFLFLVLRFLWSWLLWCLALRALSQTTLRLQATHPDHVGGVGFLQDVADSYMLFTLSIATVLSATWIDEIRATGVTAATFAPNFIFHIVFALVVGVGPYLLLSPSLFRSKRAGSARFAGLGRSYIEAFDERWLAKREPVAPPLLGTPDLQSLADLGNSFGLVEGMRLSVVSAGKVSRLVLFTVVPLVPLALLEMPATEMARKLIELIV